MTEGTRDISPVNPADFVLARKRKKYKFALFHNSPLCFEFEEWDRTFQPHVIEIGAGTGLFSVEQAMQYPDRRFLAVDVKGDRLQKGACEAEERGLTNIRFLRARGDQLPEIIPNSSVDSLWITFPDPYPKKRSASRRLTHWHFLSIYARLLSFEGSLNFKTDEPTLFAWSLEELVGHDWNIKELSFDLHESELSEQYKHMTTYEARFVSQGLKIGFVRAIPPVVSEPSRR